MLAYKRQLLLHIVKKRLKRLRSGTSILMPGTEVPW